MTGGEQEPISAIDISLPSPLPSLITPSHSHSLLPTRNRPAALSLLQHHEADGGGGEEADDDDVACLSRAQKRQLWLSLRRGPGNWFSLCDFCVCVGGGGSTTLSTLPPTPFRF